MFEFVFKKMLLFGFGFGGLILGGIVAHETVSLFGELPVWVHGLAIAVPLIILGALLARFVRSRFPNSMFVEKFGFEPGHIGVMSFGILAGAFLSSLVTKVEINFDNGTPQAVAVQVRGKDFMIPAGSTAKISLRPGKISMNVGGKDTVVNATESLGHYIFNIAGNNVYLLSEVAYGDASALTPEADSNSLNLIKDVFFHTKADYLFKEPDQIFVNKRRNGAVVRKKVLYRLSDLLKESEEQEEVEKLQPDAVK